MNLLRFLLPVTEKSEVNNKAEISRTKRYLPPAHYLLRVDKYSLLAKCDKYASGLFEAGGYKWRLHVYPNGDEKTKGKNFMSLYLVIAETESLPVGWEVNVNFKLFIHNQQEDNYLTLLDGNGGVKRFHEMKKSWGFSEFIELETFNDPANGYLMSDSCVFGAEVLVVKNSCTWESFRFDVGSMKTSSSTFTCKMENFSSLDKLFYHSKTFLFAEKNWNIRIYPDGYGVCKGKSMSLYLVTNGWKDDSILSSTYAEYKLRVVDHVYGKHKELITRKWFSPPDNNGYGFPNFIPLDDLRDPSNGFILNDSITVEVEFMALSNSKHCS